MVHIVDYMIYNLLIIKLVGTVSLNYSKTGDADPESELKLGITYFIF
jgi:hypothetical protein